MSKIIRVFACLFTLFFVGSAYAAGYTCNDLKKYTSCTSGYYLSDCGASGNWNGQTISSPAVGNSCIKGTDGNYTYSGGAVCPKKSKVPCAAGNYLPANKSSASDCAICPNGSYCVGGDFTPNYGSDQGIATCPTASASTAAATSSYPDVFYPYTSTSGSVDKTTTPTRNVINNQSWGTGWATINDCKAAYGFTNAGGSFNSDNVRYNSSTGKYDNFSGADIYYSSAVAGYYLYTKYSDTYCNTGTNRMLYRKTVVCPAGYYCPGGSVPQCSTGTHNNEWGRTICPAGKYCPAGASAGTNCSAGTYRSSTGGTAASSCTACAIGSYSSAGATGCTACTGGKTTTATGQSSCNATCTNATGASTWTAASWSANSVTNKCAINACATGYTRGGTASSTGTSSYTCSANCNAVTLNATTNGGSANSTVYKRTGSTTWYSNNTCSTSITSITKPTKTNATYAGHYNTSSNSGGTQCVNSSGTLSTSTSCNVTGSTTFYARYNCNTGYTASGTTIAGTCAANCIAVTLNNTQNGGTGGTTTLYKRVGSTTIYSDSACSTALTLSKPTKTNATYAGHYNTTATSGGTQCVTSAGAWNSGFNPTGATTCYARYNCNTGYTASGTTIAGTCAATTNTITLNKNGGTGTCGGQSSTTNGSTTCTTGSSKTLPTWDSSTCNITNGNKIFKGWSTSSSATSGSTSITCPTGAATYYAAWTTPTCSATNGTCTITTPSGNAPRATISCNMGYSQSGGTNRTTSFTVTGTAGGTSVSGTCYAVTSTVSFNLNNGTGNQPNNVTATYGSNMPALSTSANPSRTGYTFGGWYDTSAATGGTQYYNTSRGSARTWNKTDANVTLYARWTVNSYTCDAKYYLNGTTCTLCEAGYSCPSSQQTYTYNGGIQGRTYCAAGTYNSGTGNTSCTTCPAGKYCTGGTNNTACPAGTARSATGGKASADCTTCAAGTYTSTTGQTSCASCGSGYYCTGGSNRSTCSALTGVSVSGGSYTSVSPYNASTTCRYTAPTKTITGCSAVTSSTVAYSGTAWPATTYNVTASGGYVIANNNTANATCNACGDGTYSAGGSATSCSACSALTGVSVSGGTYTSVSPRNANTTCRYKAPNKTITGCSAVTTNTVSYSGSAWPATTYSVSAGGGYVIANNNTASATCTQCTGATFSAGGSATSCTACPAQTSGWTRNSGNGWSTVSQCNQTQTPANCASGQVRQYATSATAWGDVEVSTALTAKANYYVNGTSCSACSSLGGGMYKNSAAGNSGGNGVCKTDSLAGKYLAKSTDVAATNCGAGKYKAAHTLSYPNTSSCNTATAGYYAPGPTSSGQTQCVVGSFSAAGASACTACGDGANWGMTTTGAGATSCNKECAVTGAKGYANAKWNSNNTVTGLCVANSCEANYYLDATRDSNNEITASSCKLCSSFANGLYPHSSNSGTSQGKEACFVRRNELPGQYISAGALAATDCPAGTYNGTSDETAVHYGEGFSCKTCAADTYAAGEGNEECTACLENYHTFGEKTSEAACRILCQGGSYLATARATECSAVGVGYWAESSYVTQGNVGTRNACAAGLTTIGYGKGADEAADCGHALHVGDGKLYLRSEKKTTPSLVVNIGGKTFYGNMSTETKKISDGSSKSLKIKYNNAPYCVYDDSGEFYNSGSTSSVVISPNLVAKAIVPAAYNTAAGETSWSATLSDGTAVAGAALCSATTGANGDISAAGFSPEGSGTGCWCQLTAPAKGAKWVYATTNASCADKCGYFCAQNMNGTSAKNITYRTNLYSAAGIKTE